MWYAFFIGLPPKFLPVSQDCWQGDVPPHSWFRACIFFLPPPKEVTFFDSIYGLYLSHQYTVVCCCKLNNTQFCDKHLFRQVSKNTGCYQLPDLQMTLWAITRSQQHILQITIFHMLELCWQLPCTASTPIFLTCGFSSCLFFLPLARYELRSPGLQAVVLPIKPTLLVAKKLSVKISRDYFSAWPTLSAPSSSWPRARTQWRNLFTDLNESSFWKVSGLWKNNTKLKFLKAKTESSSFNFENNFFTVHIVQTTSFFTVKIYLVPLVQFPIVNSPSFEKVITQTESV